MIMGFFYARTINFDFASLLNNSCEKKRCMSSVRTATAMYAYTKCSNTQHVFHEFALEYFCILISFCEGRDGVVVVHRTPNRDVLGSSHTSGILLCP